MTKIYRKNSTLDIIIVLVIVTLLCLAFLTSCEEEIPEPTLTELVFEKLSGDWGLNNGAGSIMVDGTDVSANYPGFSLAFADGTYTTTNAADLLDASGTWEWIDEEGKLLRLNDGKEVTIMSLTELRFTFSFTHNQGGLRAGIPGGYTISVVK